MKKHSSARISSYIHGIDRMFQLLKAEFSVELSRFGYSFDEEGKKINNALTSLLDGGADFSAINTEPYQEFSPGVWTSIDAPSSESWIVASHHVVTADDGETRSRIGKLRIHPVKTNVSKPRWITLECSVDLAELKKAQDVKLDLGGFFEIYSAGKPTDLRSAHIFLRLKIADQEQQDISIGYIPMTTVPFQHTKISRAPLAELAMNTVEGVSLIISLPTSGDYVFNLTYLSLSST